MIEELFVLWLSCLLIGVSVEDVVLKHEYDVEDDRHGAEHPLHDVETAPREGRSVVTHRLDHVLQNTERPSDEI